MISSFQEAESDLVRELEYHGLKTTPTAMVPLRAINFSRLINIYDHEERFLREVFISSLQDAHRARLTAGAGGTRNINAEDVRTAMLMLGSAVRAANEETFSQANKSVIQEICPFCA